MRCPRSLPLASAGPPTQPAFWWRWRAAWMGTGPLVRPQHGARKGSRGRWGCAAHRRDAAAADRQHRPAASHGCPWSGGGLGGPGPSAGLTWQQGHWSGHGVAAAAAPGTVGTVVHQQLLAGRVTPLPAMAALGGGGGPGGTSLGAYNKWEIRQQILGNRRAN